MKRILAADIGGTNSRFAAFTLEAGALRHGQSVWLPTSQSTSFAHLLEQLGEADFPCMPHLADMVVLAVAGPVEDGRRAELANIPWDIDLDDLSPDKGCTTAILINDFMAQAYACLSPASTGTVCILPGTPIPDTPKAIMGAGTGFGHALILEPSPGTVVAIPSEGGHALFPFVNNEEMEFAQFLMAETGRSRVVGDMVVSGTGIRTLHAFFTGERISAREVTARLTPDSPVLSWFARFFGRACHDFVLKTLARGGLYLTGGVASGNPAIVRHPAFAEEFLDSDRYRHMLSTIPVQLNINEEFGLWGAAQLGAMRLADAAGNHRT